MANLRQNNKQRWFSLPQILPLIFLFALISSSSAVLAEVSIKIASLAWEPYIGDEIKNNGYVGELIIKAFAIKGYNPEIVYLPWARAVMMTKTGCFEAYGPEYYSEDIKNDFFFSKEFPGGPLGFFKMKKNRINYRRLEDLKPYSIGIVRGYVNTAEFDSAGYLKKEDVTNDEMNFRKLIAGRVDLIVCDKKVGEFIIRQHFKDRAGEIEFMSPPLEENKKLFLCVSKKIPGALKIIEDFNEGVRLLLEEESFEEMMKRNGL